MHDKKKSSFAFLVLMYNHQEYILEHLESIKFQVVTYGANLDVDMIVNDDCSQDKTRALIDRWFATNRDLFKNVEFIYNPKNLGTSASVANALDHMTTERCKLTAGDDVYSYENIFELSHCTPDVSMLTGRVLYLYGSDLQFHAFSNYFETATQAVYEKAVPLYRFKHYSFTNAPNLVYSVKCLMDRKVRDFLKQVRTASVIPTEGVVWLDELRTLAQPFLTGGAIDGIAALLHLARELDGDSGFTPKNLRTYLREVEDRVQQNNPPTMPVTTLATLHAAKGLEWDRVFLIGVSDGVLPLENNSTTGDQASIDEELRLFYVGITRAKSDLRLSYRGKASRFLAEAGLTN